MRTLRHLDLFSGIGGFAFAAEMLGGLETTQFVEIDKSVHPVLRARFPGVPIHDDISTFTVASGQFDLITAGFPCQDLSVANPAGKGLDGSRSGLFYEVVRIVRECRPRYLVLENVPALLSGNGGGDMASVLWELSQIGFDAEWDVIPASLVGANHLRQRLWIVAYPVRFRGESGRENQPLHHPNRDDPASQSRRRSLQRPIDAGFTSPWPPRLSGISAVPRMDDGLSARMDKRRPSRSRS